MLRALDTNFDLPVPVLIEHARSPLELGYLTSIEVVGEELFGNVALTAEADALLAKSGARSLSVGLSGDLSSIREVSVVSNPRVADARLFSGSLEPGSWQGPCNPAVKPLPQPLSSATQPSAGQASLAQERGAGTDAEVLIARCIRDGRLVPAQAEFARLLLQTPGAITFGERSVSVAEIFERLIERQVPHRLFNELGREGVQDYSEHLLLPEEADFYRKHFPEISLDDIAQRKRAHPST
ncbi:MAG: phage protease [Fimbriimonadaceae bacterium]|nr:phage protease [Fimbriimonadaceae bacterium]